MLQQSGWSETSAVGFDLRADSNGIDLASVVQERVERDLREIRADHVDGKLVVTFKALPHWEPYLEAVLAKQTATESASDPVSTSERKTGLLRAAGGPRVAINAEGNLVPLRHAV